MSTINKNINRCFEQVGTVVTKWNTFGLWDKREPRCATDVDSESTGASSAEELTATQAALKKGRT